MIRFALFVYIVLGITSCNTQKSLPSLPQNVAYVMKIKSTPTGPSPFILQLDLHSLDIIQETPASHYYSYLTILDDGQLLLTYSRDNFNLKRQVDRYHANQLKQPDSFITTRHHYPSEVFQVNDGFLVVLGAHHSGDLFVEFFNHQGRYQQTMLIHKEAMCLYGSIVRIDHSLLFFIQDYSTMPPSKQKVLSLNLNTFEVTELLASDLTHLTSSINSVYYHPSGHLYVSCHKQASSESSVNHNIYVFSYPDFTLTNTIPTHSQPLYLVSFPNQHKLYVKHDLSLSIIDTNLGTTIKEIPLAATRMEKVSDTQLLIWHTRHLDPSSSAPTHYLSVLDIESDEIVKEFSGQFGPISRNLSLIGK